MNSIIENTNKRNYFFEALFRECDGGDLSEYEYTGGDSNNNVYRHLNVFSFKQSLYKWLTKPDRQPRCICGVPIKYNCYVSNIVTHKTAVVGSCCIKRCMPDQLTRQCLSCGTKKKICVGFSVQVVKKTKKN